MFFLLFWFRQIKLTQNYPFRSFLDEPTIVTLDQSTLKNIPNHLRSLISHLGKRNPTQTDLMNALVIASGLETGFIGAWCCGGDIEDVLKAYVLNQCYSFDRRLLQDFAKMPTQDNDDPLNTFRFKLSLDPVQEILVHSFESGDLLLLTAHLIGNSVMTSTRTVPLSISRYIVHKRPSLKDLPKAFRNLRELSIKLKNELFLPFRNDTLYDSSLPYPALPGMPEEILQIEICKYLTPKDCYALASTCKFIRNAVKLWA